MFCKYVLTVKLGDRERPDSEQLGMSNLPVYFKNSEQFGFNEQFCNDQIYPSSTVLLKF
jgi:hypothetical protein